MNIPDFVHPLLAIVQVVAAIAVIVLVLLQQGKGADMGSSFGGGSAGSLFGAAGAANFFSRLTKWVAVLFFAATLGLAYLGHRNDAAPQASGAGLIQNYQAPVAPKGSDVPSVPSTDSAAPAPTAAPAAGSDKPAAPQSN